MGIAACGGGESQDANEPDGDFPVEIVTAEFPSGQNIAETSELRLGVKNTGDETIPDLAMTIFTEPQASASEAGEDAGVNDVDTSSSEDTPDEQSGTTEDTTSGDDDSEVGGTASGSFSIVDQQAGLATPSRPVWVLESGYPKLAGKGASAGAATALTNTYSFGPLKAGDTRVVVFSLTTVQAGDYTVNYRIAAGLTGKAVALTGDGSVPERQFVVRISDIPPQTRVTESGEVVPIKKSSVLGQAGGTEQQTEVSPSP
ncbi:MAG: hypothetical protein EXQ70_05095 [Solirubrobacterales bacterium]|nr:hypothetical protein [Solirubrobacterales bacterium]